MLSINVMLINYDRMLSFNAFFQHAGFDLSQYPRLAAWYDNCKVLKGYEEDQAVAQQVGAYFKSLVTEGM